jgi:hypothetical protein
MWKLLAMKQKEQFFNTFITMSFELFEYQYQDSTIIYFLQLKKKGYLTKLCLKRQACEIHQIGHQFDMKKYAFRAVFYGFLQAINSWLHRLVNPASYLSLKV